MLKKLKFFGVAFLGMTMLSSGAFADIDAGTVVNSVPVNPATAMSFMNQQQREMTNKMAQIRKDGNEFEDEKGFWSGGGGRAVMDVVGAGIGGAALGIGGAQIMKASNRANFTKEQQEWMAEVGDHIRCFIGSEEVGMFSDIISTEME